MINLPKKISDKIIRDYPTLKLSTINKRYTIYAEAVLTELIKSIISNSGYNKDNNTYSIATDKIGTKCGTFNINGKAHKVTTLFARYCPLYKVHTLGSKTNKTNSSVIITTDTIAKLRNTYMDDNTSLEIPDNYKDYIAQALEYKDRGLEFIYTKIDCASLNNFIGVCQRDLKNGHYIYKGKVVQFSTAEKHKKENEMLYAMMILAIAKENDGHLPQIYETSMSGRAYYKGVNLQNCPKAIRFAALGNCYQYDIDASAQSIMLNQARIIFESENINIKVEDVYKNIYLYIKDKENTRKMLLSDLNNSIDDANKHSETLTKELYPVTEKQIKAAMTALGFGARASNSNWVENGRFKSSALREIFVRKEITDIFLKHWFVADFTKQLMELSKFIYDYYDSKDNNFEVVEGMPYTKPNKTKSQVLAHIYQSLESKTLTDIVSRIGYQSVSVLVHDGFMTKHKVSIDVKASLPTLVNNPFLRISSEEYYAFKPLPGTTDVDNAIMEHKVRIAREEENARNYHSELIDNTRMRKSTDVPYFSHRECPEHYIDDDDLVSPYNNHASSY